ncbi:hypothetical protein HELRODRAFT_85974 [Helobdella robusta]|uniref:Polycystin domain-containing protein n=1 Tax=Helobdella robusta TaxID=6412 RepID=T1G654_HELRO|nr:hypothetical protein HELRODRAFT_85974 [Helobdella robusta]ESN96936.1 hypothetical protein HELRODRAFT_85974 [Helobdella robusta]
MTRINFEGLSCNTTRIVQSRDPDNRELFLKMALIELIVHTLFLVIIILIADSPGFKQVYDITNSVNSLFVQSPVRKEKPYVTFNNISRREEVWDYLENGLISGLFWEIDEGKGTDSVDIEISNILYKNTLVDSAQIRQIRVVNTTCTVLMKPVLCYFPYGVGGVYKEKLKGTYGTEFSNFNKLGFGKYYGKVSVYGNEGYTYQLPQSKSKVLSNLGTMKSNQWLDRSTRVLLIEFILHNKNLHSYCFVNLAVEFPVTGGVMTSYNLRVVRIARFNFSEILILLLEICFYLFIFYYLFVIFLEVGSIYFSHLKH